MTMVKPGDDRAFLGHPRGLGYLAFAEACERFSFYSMQNLLVLYMVKYLLSPGHVGQVIGMAGLRGSLFGGLTGQPLSSAIFGTYTALVYLAPLLGGQIADNWLGRRKTLFAGAIIMALGHFLMAFTATFFFALVALVVGCGLFKGNISSQVGALYAPGDLRRAMAFQIFYMAISISVIVAPLVSGTLGEKVGWHWGFGAAGVVMVLGLFIYRAASPFLPPDNRPEKPREGRSAPRPAWATGDSGRLAAMLVLVPVLAIAMLPNQQIFNAYLVWADARFQLTFFGMTLPTTYVIGIDAALSFAMLAGVAGFWAWWGKAHREPDELGKMVIGSLFTIAGAGCLALAALQPATVKIGLWLPLLFHLFNSIGFAQILPVGQALFSRLAPQRLAGTAMGIFYLALFLANAVVGKVGGWYSTMPTPQFWLLHMASAMVGLVAFGAFKLWLAPRLMPDAAPA